jgi:hypothetical protein
VTQLDRLLREHPTSAYTPDAKAWQAVLQLLLVRTAEQGQSNWPDLTFYRAGLGAEIAHVTEIILRRTPGDPAKEPGDGPPAARTVCPARR